MESSTFLATQLLVCASSLACPSLSFVIVKLPTVADFYFFCLLYRLKRICLCIFILSSGSIREKDDSMVCVPSLIRLFLLILVSKKFSRLCMPYGYTLISLRVIIYLCLFFWSNLLALDSLENYLCYFSILDYVACVPILVFCSFLTSILTSLL